MTQEMIYHPQVASLETVMSYGSLGLLNTLAQHNNDLSIKKKNVFLINGATVVRNCYSNGKNLSDNEVLKAIHQDFEYIRHHIEMYATQDTYVIFYFHPTINTMIPEHTRRKSTPFREAVARLTSIVASSETLKSNKLVLLNKHNNVAYYGLLVQGTFAYKFLSHHIRTLLKQDVPKIYVLTHCPIDYFLTDEYAQAEYILSHTGKILTKKDFSQKVFQTEDIPFTRVMYKFFGDKEYLTPICKNRPKALEILKSVKLRLKTEKELEQLLKSKFDIDLKLLRWVL